MQVDEVKRIHPSWSADEAAASGSLPVQRCFASESDYKNCVLIDKPKNVTINAIRTLKLTNYSLTQNNLALSNKDDKKVWFDKAPSRAYGHWRNE